MKPGSAWDVVAILCLLGFTALTVFDQRQGAGGIVREVLLVLAVLAMWVSLRLG